MRGITAALVTVISACSGGTDDGEAVKRTATTLRAPETSAARSGRDGLRARLPMGDDPCPRERPFDFGYLPPGFEDDVEPGPHRPGTTVEPFDELYDPVAHLDGGGSYLNLYHGNSWRLVPIPMRELSVFGRPAVLSAFDDGHPLVEFQATTTGSGCDWWAIEGKAVSEASLLRVVRGLRLR